MKQRDYYFDNVKLILIFLVVLGHFTNLNRLIPFMGGVNNIIYSFHMPVFVFVSGYFSKNIHKQRKQEIDKILYVYITFEILYFVFTKITSFGGGSLDIFTPTYQNWYILGMFFWRLLIPYFNFYSKGVMLILAIILSLSIGFFNDFNTFLGLYRIIYFFPIFIMGYYSQSFNLTIDKLRKHRTLIIIILTITFASIYSLSEFNSFNNIISYAYTPYGGYNSKTQIAARIIGLISSLIISVLILSIIPKKHTAYTHLGKNTMNVFLLHMFLVFPIDAVFYKFNFSALIILILSIIGSVGITYLFSLNWVSILMKPFTNLENFLSLTKNIVYLKDRPKLEDDSDKKT